MRKLSSICSLAALVLFGACDRGTSVTANDPLKTDLALADLAQPYQAQQNTLFPGEQIVSASATDQPALDAEIAVTSPVSTPKVVTARVGSPRPPMAATIRARRSAAGKNVVVARSVGPKLNGASSTRSIAVSNAAVAPRSRSGSAASPTGAGTVDHSPVPARTTYGTSNGSVGDSPNGGLGDANDGTINGSPEAPPTGRSRNTVRSTVIGAGAGAVLGAVVNRGNRGRGAAIGGVAGAILGAVVGNNSSSQR